MDPFSLERFRHAISVEHGLILVTGPTGSGKSTTLYSALKELDTRERNAVTLEDPIEYRLDGISQTQINLKKGMTFASGLRSVLRQDPDIIMVGEIRDAETAMMAVQAALTGHLVFSTLHTNDAASAVTRLMDLGIEPYLLASSLVSVLAQRLVRKLCDTCREPLDLPLLSNRDALDISSLSRDFTTINSSPPSPVLTGEGPGVRVSPPSHQSPILIGRGPEMTALDSVSFPPSPRFGERGPGVGGLPHENGSPDRPIPWISPVPFTEYVAKGCPECRDTGHRGRFGIYELLIVDEDIRSLITHRSHSTQIRDAAIKKGMQLLNHAGELKIASGETTREEVQRVTMRATM